MELTDRSTVLTAQRVWAARHGLSVDPHGYLPDVRSNLRQAFSETTHTAFKSGSGSELRDQPASERRPARAAKMRALHSSSALAANVFDFWVGRDISRVLAAIHVEGVAGTLSFEKKLPTGASGTPPNLDVVISLIGGGLLGIESKFTEWMSAKRDMTGSLAPYLDLKNETSYWSRAGFDAAHRLVTEISKGKMAFAYLDVPQLLKHALGLKRAANGDWHLRYLYFDIQGDLADEHARELERFEKAVGEELHFRALRYQDILIALGTPRSEQEAEYFSYLADRYFQGM